MDATLNITKLKKHLSYEDQVREVIRGKVISGEFAAGEMIPSSRKIAASLGTGLCTVHRALSTLQDEGLLISYPRKGIFVQKREEKLTCVAVYCGSPAQKMAFVNSVNNALREELHQAGIELDVWVDPRPPEQHGEPWQALIKAAEHRRFQAFIGTETNLSLLQWQQKLPVPTAFLAAPPSMPNNVDYNMWQFVEISLRELANQGCRSVGFISPLLTALDRGNPKGGYVWAFDMLEHFTDIASELNLTIKNDWMRIIKNEPEGGKGQEHFGYEQFLKLWSQSERPEGLLVYPDTTVRGMITAIREKQVRVPEELKLALHKNESMDLLCPMPATFVVNSAREMARALIEQVQKQFRGESCEPISLPFKLVAHNNP